MKKALFLSIVCALVACTFIGYKLYKRHQLYNNYSEVVKNTTYKTLAVVEGELGGSAILQNEMFNRLEVAINSIERNKNLVRLLSKNAEDEVSAASMNYIENCEQLVRIIEAKYRIAIGTAKEIATAREAMADTRDHGRLSRREISRNALLLSNSFLWLAEGKKYAGDLGTIIGKLKQSRVQAAIFLPSDALIPISKIEELTRVNAEENK